jgi:hypothetical protein
LGVLLFGLGRHALIKRALVGALSSAHKNCRNITQLA